MASFENELRFNSCERGSAADENRNERTQNESFDRGLSARYRLAPMIEQFISLGRIKVRKEDC